MKKTVTCLLSWLWSLVILAAVTCRAGSNPSTRLVVNSPTLAADQKQVVRQATTAALNELLRFSLERTLVIYSVVKGVCLGSGGGDKT